MTRQLRKVYVALFLGLLVVLGVWSFANSLGFVRPNDASVLDGKWAKAFEGFYDKQFPVKRLGTNLWAAVDYLAFDEGRPGVVIGRQQWLYSDEEFDPIADGKKNVQDNWALIRGIRDRLASQHIKLVLAILPAKSRLYPEHLGNTRPAAMHEPMYQQFHAQAQQDGILAPDLLAPMEQAKGNTQVFLRTDTHWTPAGAEAVAQALAHFVHGDQLLSGDPQRYVTENGEVKQHKGDLLNFLPLDPLFTRLMPPPDELQERTTHAATEQASGDDALFGDNQIPVALVGTSYSANPNWNFLGALRQALQSDVVNYAENGHGPIVPMLKYLQTDAFKNSPPQVVIWEFPERYLPMVTDLSGFDTQWIAQLKNPAGGAEQLVSAADKGSSPIGTQH